MKIVIKIKNVNTFFWRKLQENTGNILINILEKIYDFEKCRILIIYFNIL